MKSAANPNPNPSPIDRVFQKSQELLQYKDLEFLAEHSKLLPEMPLQPLHALLRSGESQQVGEILPYLAPEQRQNLLDLDTWNRDRLNPQGVEFWLEAYSCKSHSAQLSLEFIQSSSFLLYLKGLFHISTFDLEDPQYPQHDHYFLTEDNLLLFEYPENYPHLDAVKNLIKLLYSQWGVEKAYSFLFKLVVDSYLLFEETEYKYKVGRLEELGIPDYYQALQGVASYQSLTQIDHFIKKKSHHPPQSSGEYWPTVALPSAFTVGGLRGLQEVQKELASIGDPVRINHLAWNWVYLVNQVVVVQNGQLDPQSKQGSLPLDLIRPYLVLGLHYLRTRCSLERSLFSCFDFTEVFRIGLSLLEIPRKKIKSALGKYKLDSEKGQEFLGEYWNHYLEGIYAQNIHSGTQSGVQLFNLPRHHQLTWEDYCQNSEKMECFLQLLPFISQLHQLKEKEQRKFLNYSEGEEDFEVVVITLLIQLWLTQSGHQDSSHDRVDIGVHYSHLTIFLDHFMEKGENQWTWPARGDSRLEPLMKCAEKMLKVPISASLSHFFHSIFDHHLSGPQYQQLQEEDKRYLGGVLLSPSLTEASIH